jgi:hypothetical protein
MSHDVFCVVCGVVAGTPDYSDEAARDPDHVNFPWSYDPDIVSREDIRWTEDVRVIGENPDCGMPDRYGFPLLVGRRDGVAKIRVECLSQVQLLMSAAVSSY